MSRVGIRVSPLEFPLREHKSPTLKILENYSKFTIWSTPGLSWKLPKNHLKQLPENYKKKNKYKKCNFLVFRCSRNFSVIFRTVQGAPNGHFWVIFQDFRGGGILYSLRGNWDPESRGRGLEKEDGSESKEKNQRRREQREARKKHDSQRCDRILWAMTWGGAKRSSSAKWWFSLLMIWGFWGPGVQTSWQSSVRSKTMLRCTLKW